MNKLKDIIKAIGNIFCPCIKAIKNRLSPYIDDLGEYFQDNIGTQKDRFKLYLLMLVSGVILSLFHNPILWFLMLLTSLGTNPIFASAIAILLLSLPAVTFNWWLKNHDQLQQFKDTSQQQTEALFSHALQLLFKERNIIANSVGLKELIRLRHATEDQELIKRIDLITMSGLDLKEAELMNADLKDADLLRADLMGANLQEAVLQEADLQEADLEAANLQGAELQEANLEAANLQGADLREAKLQGADLQEANLQGAKLQGAIMFGANLQRVNLQKTKNLKETNFLEADLRKAKLQGANLEETRNLQTAKLKGAIYDETKFPKGFDPKAHGMIHEDDLPKEP